jgi:hypothetical protein
MWYYTQNNQQVGPVDEKEIKKLVASGVITSATMVWTTGMANWQVISQTALATLLGSVPPPPMVAGMPPALVVENPKVAELKKLFMWFWISLIAAIPTFGATAVASGVLFFIIVYKAWKLVQHEGVRGDADKMVAYSFIPGWNFYWYFPAFRGLAKEINSVLDKENIVAEHINLDLATWMIITMYASGTGIAAIAFLVLWIMYTNKVKNAAIAITIARKL